MHFKKLFILSNRNILFSIIIFAIILRFSLFVGVSSPDSYAYSQHAFNIMSGVFKVSSIDYVYGIRFLLTAPTAISYAIFGIGDIAAAIWPFFCSIASIILIFYLGKLLFDERVGLLAAFLLSFFPLDTLLSTQILPDPILNFFVGLSIFFFLKSEKYERWRFVNFSYFLSGLLLGVATLARMTGIVPILFFFVYLLYSRKIKIGYVYLISGIAFIFVVTSFFYYLICGDFLFNFHILNITYEGVDSFDNFQFYFKALAGFNLEALATFGFFYYFFIIGLIFCWKRKKLKEIIIPILWFLSIFLFMEFGSSSILKYRPIIKSFRYLSILTFPTVLISAFFLKEISVYHCKKILRKTLTLTFICFLFLTSLYGTYRVRKNILEDTIPFKTAAQFLRNQSEKDIYCIHFRWPIILNYYFRYNKGYNFYGTSEENKNSLLKYIYNIEEPGQIKNSYIIIDKRYLYFDLAGRKIERREEIPEFIYNPPKKWKILKKFGDVTIYLILP